MYKPVITSILAAASLLAQTINVNNSTKPLDITIYNNNLGFVKQTKNFNSPASAEHYIAYEGVPNSIIIDSVIPTFSKKTTLLYSQNFEQNNVDYRSILKYYKKHNLDVKFYASTLDTTKKELSTGKIISNIQNMMTLQKDNGTVHSVNISNIYFDRLPQELKRTKPSLTWRVFSKKGAQNVDLKYLMNNISWDANYTLELDKPNGNLKGWITIKNNTGIEFEDANIYCLAGQVNKVTPDRYARKELMAKAQIAMDGAMPFEVKEQSLSGYHLYTIPFKETISKGSKQISFIQKPKVKYEQIAKLNTSMPTYQVHNIQKFTFDHIVQIKNEKSNGLGLPLPKGIVRVFSKDEKNKTHFIGENRINHTANKDDIKIKIGKFFDIKAQIKQTKFKSKKTPLDRYMLSQIQTKITNEDKEVRTIHIDQTHNGYGSYKLTSTCTNICEQKKISPTKTRYIITLKPKEDYTFTTTYELH